MFKNENDYRCQGAEGTDRPLFLFSQGKTVQDWSNGYDWP
jgi:hypothetical protein